MSRTLRALGIGLYLDARYPNNTDEHARKTAEQAIDDEYVIVTDKMRHAFRVGMDTAQGVMRESDMRRERIAQQDEQIMALSARVAELEAALAAARPEPTPEEMGVVEIVETEGSEPENG